MTYTGTLRFMADHLTIVQSYDGSTLGLLMTRIQSSDGHPPSTVM